MTISKISNDLKRKSPFSFADKALCNAVNNFDPAGPTKIGKTILFANSNSTLIRIGKIALATFLGIFQDLGNSLYHIGVGLLKTVSIIYALEGIQHLSYGIVTLINTPFNIPCRIVLAAMKFKTTPKDTIRPTHDVDNVEQIIVPNVIMNAPQNRAIINDKYDEMLQKIESMCQVCENKADSHLKRLAEPEI